MIQKKKINLQKFLFLLFDFNARIGKPGPRFVRDFVEEILEYRSMDLVQI